MSGALRAYQASFKLFVAVEHLFLNDGHYRSLALLMSGVHHLNGDRFGGVQVRSLYCLMLVSSSCRLTFELTVLFGWLRELIVNFELIPAALKTILSGAVFVNQAIGS